MAYQREFIALGFGFRQQPQEEYWVNAVLLAVLPASSTLTIRSVVSQDSELEVFVIKFQLK